MPLDLVLEIGLPGEATAWNQMLESLRKNKKLSSYPTTRLTTFKWNELEEIFSASEIAYCKMQEIGNFSLDCILCNPLLARKFDDLAMSVVPGHQPLLYRWGALKLRKDSAKAGARASQLKIGNFELCSPIGIQKRSLNSITDDRGVFLVQNSQAQAIYAAESMNLRDRLLKTFSSKQPFWRGLGELAIRILPLPAKSQLDLQGYRVKLVEREAPALNSTNWNAAS